MFAFLCLIVPPVFRVISGFWFCPPFFCFYIMLGIASGNWVLVCVWYVLPSVFVRFNVSWRYRPDCLPVLFI